MSIIPLLCLVLVACVSAQNLNKLDDETNDLVKRGRWTPTFQHTGGLSGNVGANYRSNKGHNIGGYVHGNLNGGRVIDGAGLRGSYNLGNGMRLGGYVHHNFGGGTGGGISFSKSWGKKRSSTVCMSRCAYACRTSTVKCMKNCLVNMC